MKHALLIALFAITFNSHAADMSRTEDRNKVYVLQADGSELYRGGCSLHQDYENDLFVVTKEIVPYFEPREYSEYGFAMRMKGVEKDLLTKAAKEAGVDLLSEADDITVETIRSIEFQGMDLWRLNIGVGGGNGMYLVFNRTVVNKRPHYEIVSNVFDGDLVFCDSSVWLVRK